MHPFVPFDRGGGVRDEEAEHFQPQLRCSSGCNEGKFNKSHPERCHRRFVDIAETTLNTANLHRHAPKLMWATLWTAQVVGWKHASVLKGRQATMTVEDK